jgi:aryl sulfotransferase
MPDGTTRRIYRTWILDSRRWDRYQPRAGDIVVATSPKCGTTWMQRIVALLVFQSPQVLPLWQVSPWIERRFPEPIAAVMARLEAQRHRRFVETHLPLDGLPVLPGARWIHVARDGRDACMSFHNHGTGFTDEMLAGLDRAGLEDEAVGRPYPRVPADPAEHFHRWLTQGAVPGDDGSPMMSFFRFERTWWEARRRANVLLVHYNDLTADLSGEMRRIADFLGISVAPDLWPDLIEAAGFEAMRRDGDALMGSVAASFEGGGTRFFHKGRNGRWRGVFREEDLALYDAKVEAMLPPACAQWVACGRRAAGDPRSTPD